MKLAETCARYACLTDGKVCCSIGEPQQKALHSMKSISLVLLCSPGLIRFQLLKEFLLADEMRPSSISTEPWPEIKSKHLSIAVAATVLGEACRLKAQSRRASAETVWVSHRTWGYIFQPSCWCPCVWINNIPF